MGKPFDYFEIHGDHIGIVEIDGDVGVKCPVDKEKEYLKIYIQLYPNRGKVPEVVSFKDWLLKCENELLGVEGLCHKVYDALQEICKPTTLFVKVSSGYQRIQYSYSLGNFNIIREVPDISRMGK